MKLDWKYSYDKLDEARDFYEKHGFVGFTDLLKEYELDHLKKAFAEAREEGTVEIGQEKVKNLNDAIYRHPVFEDFASHTKIIRIAEYFLHRPIELQHSKLNCKPEDSDQGRIEWHQDFPFFPHTNFDLLAIGIHFDQEDEKSGCLEVIPGSHKMGPLSHCRDGEFVYECTEMEEIDLDRKVHLRGDSGLVTVHHSLLLHASAPKKVPRERRLLVYQYRTQDAVQLSGALHKCTGYEIDGQEQVGHVRFPDGQVIENRGDDGRLYDIYRSLKPDE